VQNSAHESNKLAPGCAHIRFRDVASAQKVMESYPLGTITFTTSLGVPRAISFDYSSSNVDVHFADYWPSPPAIGPLTIDQMKKPALKELTEIVKTMGRTHDLRVIQFCLCSSRSLSVLV
jgi:hypothetical protein